MQELKHLNTASATYYLKDNGNIKVHITLNNPKINIDFFALAGIKY